MYKHILVPTDGSALSLKAAKEAAALAKKLNAKMTALYVIAPYMPSLDAEGALLMNHGSEERSYRKATGRNAGWSIGASKSVPVFLPVGGLSTIPTSPNAS